MEMTVIETKRRWDLGKNGSYRMRKEGWVPAVMYGGGEPSVPLAVDRKIMNRLLHNPGGRNHLYVLKLDDQRQKQVLIKDFQLDPIRDELVHIDFYAVSEDRPVLMRVPIHTTGVPVGVKTAGGILSVMLHDLPVECLPKDIPETITLDVSGLNVYQSLRVRDIHLGENVRILREPEVIVVQVEITRAAATETAEVAEEKAEKES